MKNWTKACVDNVWARPKAAVVGLLAEFEAKANIGPCAPPTYPPNGDPFQEMETKKTGKH